MPGKPCFLIDINGVLYADHKPIPGAAEVIDWLRRKGYSFRFVSNATQSSRSTLHKKLRSYGFKIKEQEIFSAPVATARYVKGSGKTKCFLLTTGDVYLDFLNQGITLTDIEPDYVVVGDAGKDFSFEKMNAAFNHLLEGASLIAMEKDRYWRSPEGLELCAGPYVSALEYATGKKAVLTGKPSKEFLKLALKDMKAKPADTISIGDDLLTDIRGAQRNGMKAFFVTTGKHKKEDIKRLKIKPDAVLGSIAELSSIDFLK